VTLMSIRELRVSLPVEGELRPVLRGLDLELDAGESLGLVGESGSGKSMTARAIARSLPAGAQVTGDIAFDGSSVLGLSGRALRAFQAREIGMVFQDPRAHLNPVRTVGDFLTEAMVINHGMARRVAQDRAVGLLREVGIDDGARRLRQYPHELSGGLLQRVMIAGAIACEPRLLLADEPTTALDVSTQSEVVAVLDELRREHGVALLFITHDLELAAAICDRTAVMYAGKVVEARDSDALYRNPRHPYSAGLMAARPEVERSVPRLRAIPGRPRAAFEVTGGCAFADRCPHTVDSCRTVDPPLEELSGGDVRCLRARELATARIPLCGEAER
jgi:oligopeptide/dipeptide ABC transporter ATP-binding protein